MKTPEQITEEAAQKVCEDNGITRAHDREPWAEALAWQMGEGFDYAPALQALVAAAIEADRAQRPSPRVSIFHPGSPDDVTEYVEIVAEQISEGYTSGGVYGGSGIYWESTL